MAFLMGRTVTVNTEVKASYGALVLYYSHVSQYLIWRAGGCGESFSITFVSSIRYNCPGFLPMYPGSETENMIFPVWGGCPFSLN